MLQELPELPAYSELLPPAPASSVALDACQGLSEARQVARELLQGLGDPNLKGLTLPADCTFCMATPQQLCGLCALG